jgi:hypothetical protein
MKPATRIAMVLLALVAVGHLLRVVFRVNVTIGGTVVPMWVSVLGTIVSAGLAVGLWRESQPPRAAPPG